MHNSYNKVFFNHLNGSQPSQFHQWQMWLANEARGKTSTTKTKDPENDTYEMLRGTGRWVSTDHQLFNMPAAALPHVRDVARAASMKSNI